MLTPAWPTFLEVCRLGSISAAARTLGYTQSAVSRQVAALEREVGLPLLERRARGVVPTPAGEAFRSHAQRAVNEGARALRSAREAVDQQAPAVAVGAVPSAAAGVVPNALRQLRAEVPRWTLRPGLTPELEDLVAAAELDLAVVTDAPPGLSGGTAVEVHPVGRDEMWVIVPADHPAATGGRRPLAEFAAETWAEDNPGSASLLRTHAARAGFEPRADLEAADLLGKMALVAAGHAVGLVPGLLLPSLRRDVVPVPLVDPPGRGIFALTPVAGSGGATAVAVRLLIDALHEAVAT